MTETRTYTGETGTEAYDGYAGLVIGTSYTATSRRTKRCHSQSGCEG